MNDVPDTPATEQHVDTGLSVLRSMFVAPLIAVFGFFWIATVAAIAVDPLDLYEWGTPPKLLPDYSVHKGRSMFSAAARTDVDILLIGSSTVAAITSGQLEEEFGVDKAFNFSITGPRPADRRMILAQVAEHSPAERVIVSFDWSFALPADYAHPAVPTFMFDDNIFNDLRLASPMVIGLTWQKMLGRPVGLSGWDYASTMPGDRRRYRRFQERMAREAHRPLPEIEYPAPGATDVSCSDYPLVSEILPELVDGLTSRGKAVDFIIPPYSLRLYRTWRSRTDEAALKVRPFLARQLAIRRCLVEALGSHDKVRIFAFDNETWITGDLANYRDEAHLHEPEVYSFMVSSMAEGRNRLTADNFDEYAATLIANVAGSTQNPAHDEDSER